jgi:hypothetical protein
MQGLAGLLRRVRHAGTNCNSSVTKALHYFCCLARLALERIPLLVRNSPFLVQYSLFDIRCSMVFYNTEYRTGNTEYRMGCPIFLHHFTQGQNSPFVQNPLYTTLPVLTTISEPSAKKTDLGCSFERNPNAVP